MRAVQFAFFLAALAALGGCASTPKIETSEMVQLPETHTVLSRYPARRSGILIAQNAALSEGRTLCQSQRLRFRPLGSVAGEDPSTGDAVYAVRFRCLPSRRAQAGTQGSDPAHHATDDTP